MTKKQDQKVQDPNTNQPITEPNLPIDSVDPLIDYPTTEPPPDGPPIRRK